MCARACASEHKRRVVTVTTSVGTVAMMSGLSRDPEKKKRLPVRTSDLSTSGASASLFMDACKSTSSPASSSTWRVDDRVSGRNIPYPHATTHAHVSIQSITLRLQLTPIAHTFSTADLPVRSCVSEEVESAHVAVSLITSICTETQPCTAHAHQPILATEHKMRADAGTHKTPRRRKAGTPFIHVCVCH